MPDVIVRGKDIPVNVGGWSFIMGVSASIVLALVILIKEAIS